MSLRHQLKTNLKQRYEIFVEILKEMGLYMSLDQLKNFEKPKPTYQERRDDESKSKIRNLVMLLEQKSKENKQLLEQVGEIQERVQEIESLEKQISEVDEEFQKVYSSFEEVHLELCQALFQVDPFIKQMKDARGLDHNELIEYGQKISGTTSAPPDYEEGRSTIMNTTIRAPFPTQDEWLFSLLYPNNKETELKRIKDMNQKDRIEDESEDEEESEGEEEEEEEETKRMEDEDEDEEVKKKQNERDSQMDKKKTVQVSFDEDQMKDEDEVDELDLDLLEF